MANPEFSGSPRLAAFLRFIVEETLAGRGNRIKQTTIALDVFSRDITFDAQLDPVVRMQAAKLRRALKFYYLTAGRKDALRIKVPKGSYVPVFNWQDAAKEEDALSAHVVTSDAGDPSTEPRLAVLPFVSSSGDPQKDDFAEGMTEELSTALSHFDGFSVIAYYSTLRFNSANSDLRDIGRDLGADYLLSGSIRMSGKKVRVYLQLNCTDDGATIWARQFEHASTSENIFEIQDDIVRCTIAMVGDDYGVIPRRQAQVSLGKGSTDLTSYEAILRYQNYLTVMTPWAYKEAVRALEHTVEVDPNNARAWASLGMLYRDAYVLGFNNICNACDRLIHCARKAISLDPSCPEAHLAMAMQSLTRRNYDGVMGSAEEILELNPNSSYLAGTAGWLMSLAGNFDRGLPLVKDSLELNPHYPTWLHLAPYLYHYQQNDYELALSEAQKFGLHDFFWSPLLHAGALARLDRMDEAASEHQKLQILRSDFTKRARHYISGFVMPSELVNKLLSDLKLAVHFKTKQRATGGERRSSGNPSLSILVQH